MEQHAGEHELDIDEAEHHPGAHPSASAERLELEVGAPEHHRAGLTLGLLRPDLVRHAQLVPLIVAQHLDVD